MYFKFFRFLSFIVCFSIILFSCKKDKRLPTPGGLAFTNISDTSCSINWTSVSGVAGYKITIATDASFISVVSGYNELIISNTTINVTTLTPYTKYFVKLVSYNGQLN